MSTVCYLRSGGDSSDSLVQLLAISTVLATFTNNDCYRRKNTISFSDLLLLCSFILLARLLCCVLCRAVCCVHHGTRYQVPGGTVGCVVGTHVPELVVVCCGWWYCSVVSSTYLMVSSRSGSILSLPT